MSKKQKSSRESEPFAIAHRLMLWLGVTGTVMLVVGVGFLEFDVVVPAEGVVEGQSMVRVHAPRAARIEDVHVQSGAEVKAGDLLFTLRDGELEKEVLAARLALVDREADLERATLRLRELDLLGGGFESLLAKELLPLQARELELLEEVQRMYGDLREAGSGSRMEEIQFLLRGLAAQQQQRRDQLRLKLEEDGWLRLQLEKEQLERTAAEQRVSLQREMLSRLERRLSALEVRAPADGRITRVRFRDPGATVETGDPLLTLYRPGEGYVARMVVQDRNVDLIRPGQEVRLDSNVFAVTAEGYIHGRVLELIRDEDAPLSGGFEVRVSLDHSPVEPVIGSRIRGDILLQRQGWMGLLRQKPLRETSRTPSRVEDAR